MSQTLLDKLQYKDEKNLLIQGLPSSIEKQFNKLTFAKNVTPLLKSRRIDFALVFAINENQLNGILRDVLPALHEDSKLWIAYPKAASKIATNLNRDCSWDMVVNAGYEGVDQVALDSVWSALHFKKCCQQAAGGKSCVAEDQPEQKPARTVKTKAAGTKVNLSTKAAISQASAPGGEAAVAEEVELVARTIEIPVGLQKQLNLKKHKKALDHFQQLSYSDKKEFVEWITSAKKEETRQNRLTATIEKLMAGKNSPTEK
jgi:uncharacterized protein YdeI (YjbR/CyaY-like superfamily)